MQEEHRLAVGTDLRVAVTEDAGALGLQLIAGGDDVVDLPVMRQVGFAATVADAMDDVKPFADLVTKRSGGRGAVREICDFLLKESDRWSTVTRHYFED